MKKFTATDLGGVPVTAADLVTMFTNEKWDVLQSIFSIFDTDPEGVVLSGCVVTNNAGNFDMTAGIVYQDGQFRRVAAVVNQAYPKFIVSDADVNDSRPFADGSSHVVAVTKLSKVGATAGQPISIANLTDINDRRWNVAQPPWIHHGALVNSWIVYSGGPLPAYRQNRDGSVSIVFGVDGNSAASSSVFASGLPAALRPQNDQVFPCFVANTSLIAAGRGFAVTTGGDLTIVGFVNTDKLKNLHVRYWIDAYN